MTVLEELAGGVYESDGSINYTNALVLETTFSKKELQDPNTIHKILESKDYFTSIGKYLVAIIGVIAVIASIPFLALPTFFMGPLGIGVLFGYVYLVIDAYPAKKKDKQLKQLQDQCFKLSVKMEHACHKNPEKANIYREVIKNCNRVSDAVDAYYNKVNNDAFMNEVDEATKIYQELIRWCKTPFRFEDSYLFGMFYLAELLGLNEQAIVRRLTRQGKPTSNLMKDWFSDYNQPSENVKKVVPEIEDNSLVYEIYVNDDSGVWYSPKANSFITNSGNNDMKRVKLYTASKGYSDLYPSKEAFIEADKNLGYYQLSKCPKAVTRKKLEI